MPPISTREFVRGMVFAIALLILSLAMLISFAWIYFAYLDRDFSHQGDPISSFKIAGSELLLRVGQGSSSESGQFELGGLSMNDQAIITRRVSLEASNYPFVRVSLSGVPAGVDVYLLWRTSQAPFDIQRLRLQFSGGQSDHFYLAKQQGWRGRVTEVGLDVYGDLRGRNLVINQLAFLPASWAEAFRTIWSQWNGQDTWTQGSAHFLRGTPSASILSPTVAVAAWLGLSFLLVYWGRRFAGRGVFVAMCTVLAVPWIALDFYWQHKLDGKVAESKVLFSGRSQAEKREADTDADLYLYARYLKDTVLPEPGARIFLLHDTEPQTYTRLRAQYYLLPHNTYNYDRLPNKPSLERDDYLLVIGEIPALEYDNASRTLRWGDEKLKVRLLDSHAEGDLYRVMRRRAK
ncbi:MAG: hypothetical protein AAF699_03910 [Pseudomonadota bacterium]